MTHLADPRVPVAPHNNAALRIDSDQTAVFDQYIDPFPIVHTRIPLPANCPSKAVTLRRRDQFPIAREVSQLLKIENASRRLNGNKRQ